MSPVDRLSRRQREVLELVSEGLTNKAIGGRLGISDQTVKSHLQALFAKLDVSSRIGALAAARMHPRRGPRRRRG